MTIQLDELVAKKYALLHNLGIIALTTMAPLAIFLITGDKWLSVLGATFAFIISFLSIRYVFVSHTESVNRAVIRLAALLFLGITSILFAQGLLYEFIKSIAVPLLSRWLPQLAQWDPQPTYLTIFSIGILSCVIAFAIWRITHRTSIPAHANPLRTPIVTDNFEQRLSGLAAELITNLNNLDQETNWQDKLFIPLDAEVEILTPKHRQRKVVSLLDGLKANPATNLFLVLGDPGSGKSVALRKLCRELLSETTSTRRIALYVNLKDWDTPDLLDSSTKLHQHKIREFVLQNVCSPLSLAYSRFLQDNFDALYANGQFTFVFDSFDELPLVLDLPEDAPSLKTLSSTLLRFALPGAYGRCIIASRYYKKPDISRAFSTIFHIKPFDEKRMLSVIRVHSDRPATLIRSLLTERPDLYAIAKQPFSLALLIDYTNTRKGELPETQAALYRSFLDRNLDMIRGDLILYGVGREEVEYLAIKLSEMMFRSRSFGLHLPIIQALAIIADADRNQKILSFLFKARIAVQSRSGLAFTFVHRRFQEYFLVQSLLNNPEQVHLPSIVENDRWRDSLVLYAQLVDETRALALVEYCWSIVDGASTSEQAGASERYVRSIQAQRFLREAFYNRPTLLGKYQDELAQRLKSALDSADLLTAKQALEAVALLRMNDAERLIVQALEKRVAWISETAVRACRFLGKLSSDGRSAIRDYVSTLPAADKFVRCRELYAMFSLSDAFRDARRYYIYWLCTTGLALLSCVAYSMAGIDIMLLYVMTLGIASLVLTGLALFRLRTRSPVTTFNIFREANVFSLVLLFEYQLSYWVARIISRSPENLRDGNANVRTEFSWSDPSSLFALLPHGRLGDMHVAPSALVGALLFVAMSLVAVFYYAQRWWEDFDIRDHIRTVALLAGGLVCYVFIAFLVFHFLGEYVKWLIWIAIGVFASMTVVASLHLCLALYMYTRSALLGVWEASRVTSFIEMFSGRRAQIGTALQQLRSPRSQWKYLSGVELEAMAYRRELGEEGNDWGEEARPKLLSRDLDAYLAALEERWLGLER